MMEALVLAITIGAATCTAPDGTYQWQVQYRDGSSQFGTTTDGKLTFTPRVNRDWRVRHAFNGSMYGAWSAWIPGEQFPGDSDGDCQVGGADLLTTGATFGSHCP